MSFIRDNLARVAFALGILVGVQAPNVVTQYEHRVTAHLNEVTVNFAGFQQIADQYFDGSVDRLILHHEQSTDRVFHAEAEPIRKLWQRLQHLRAEQAALSGSFVHQLAHVALRADPELRRETLDGYVATVPLTPTAIVCALVAAFVLGALVDGLLAALGAGFNRLRARSQAQRRRSQA
ncbi:MAG: DUF2937 family protein [Pseudomonadota bacterium]